MAASLDQVLAATNSVASGVSTLNGKFERLDERLTNEKADRAKCEKDCKDHREGPRGYDVRIESLEKHHTRAFGWYDIARLIVALAGFIFVLKKIGVL